MSDAGTDVVPNLPNEVSGTGIDVVPIAVPAPLKTCAHIPAVYVQSISGI